MLANTHRVSFSLTETVYEALRLGSLFHRNSFLGIADFDKLVFWLPEK